MIRKKKTAFIWTREHSPKRLFNLTKIKSAWAHLFGEKEFGHYQPIQFLPFKNMNSRRKSFDAVLNGESLHVHLTVLTTREWFIREVYNKAHALTCARYPDYDAHQFVDGDRAGERRIIFHSERHALSRNHLKSALWHVINDAEPKLKVGEFYFTESCTSAGYPEVAIDTKSFNNKLNSKNIRMVVVRHLDQIDDPLLMQIVDEIQTHGQPNLTDISVQYSWRDISDYFTELSEPELVYLNWEEANAPLSDADQQLFRSTLKFDIQGVQQALNDGANPNAIEYDETLLNQFIMACYDHVDYSKNSETSSESNNLTSASLSDAITILTLLLEAGTHPDFHNPDGTTALADTALSGQPELAELLLKYGADASISCAIDEGIGAYPTAWWGTSTNRFDPIELQEGADKVYCLMARHRNVPTFTQQEEDQDRQSAMQSEVKE